MELPETITTERLLLRQPRLADARSVFEEYARDPEVSRYLGWRPLESIQQAEEFLIERVLTGWSSGKEFSWGITRPGSDTLIGMIAYRPDGDQAGLGFVLGRGFWNRGYVTEAARAVMAQAFSLLRFQRIWAVCDVENVASVRVLEKIGMTREEILRRWTVRPNISSEPRDCFLFAKTR
jgi:RimJ/RimL family protein N-acetyltransferase